MPRPKKECKIFDLCVKHSSLTPDIEYDRTIFLYPEELQAIKLKDIEKLGIIQAGKKMGISKSTFANIYKNAHQKIATAIIHGYKIKFKC